MDPDLDLLFRYLSQFQSKGHVIKHRHVWIKGVVLKHHSYIPILGRDIIDKAVADVALPTCYTFQPSEHPQCSGFSTTGWTDQNHEFAFPNIKAYAFNRSYFRSLSRTRIDFGKIGKTHPGHIKGSTLKLYRLMGSEKPRALRFT